MKSCYSTSTHRIYGILGLIAIGIISFHYTVNVLVEPENSDIVVMMMSSGAPLLVFIVSVIMLKKYKMSKIVADSYIFFGLAFLCLSVGDILWNILYFLGMETYPSVADMVFFIAYPLLIIFHLKNMKKFTPEIFTKKASVPQITIMSSISSVLIGAYVFLSLSSIDEINFDFWYGLAFVIMASIVFSMTLHVSWIVRKGAIGRIWKLIMLGVFLTTVGDVLYYHIEVLQEFDMLHPINMVWYASYFVIIFAFFQYKKEFC